MGKEQPDEFFARVTGGANDGNFLHKKTPPDSTSGAARFPVQLPLAVLEAFARARLAVLLALFHARIARQQPFRPQSRSQIRIHGEQRARQSMTNGSGLSRRPSARYGDLCVELVGVARRGQRLGRDAPQRLHWKVVLERTTINNDLAGASG